MRYIKLKDLCLRTVNIPLFYPPLYYFIVHAAIIFGAVLVAGGSMMLNPGGFVNTLLPETYDMVEKFIKWDAHWYTYIAQQGYDELTIVFFPVLVLLIKMAAPFCNYDYGLAGFGICNIFSLICFFLMYSLFQLDFTRTVSARALTAFALMPTSFFLHSIYTESVFLTFSLACAYYARIGKWWRAGAFAALAALTRNTGVFLVFLLMCEYWAQYKKERPSRRLSSFSVLALALPPLALLGFIVYNYWLLGDPLAFVNAQKAWGREFSPPWVNIGRSFVQILHGADTAVALDLLMTMLGIAGLLSMTFLPGLNIPGSYLVIGWLWLLIPLCSASPWMPLYSMSRFVLVIFPIYLYIARLTNTLFRVFMAISAMVLALCSIMFTNWYWLS